jgi:hypothetical protein
MIPDVVRIEVWFGVDVISEAFRIADDFGECVLKGVFSNQFAKNASTYEARYCHVEFVVVVQIDLQLSKRAELIDKELAQVISVEMARLCAESDMKWMRGTEATTLG